MNMKQTQALLDALGINDSEEEQLKKEARFDRIHSLLCTFVYKFGNNGKFVFSMDQYDAIHEAIKNKFGDTASLLVEINDDEIVLQIKGNNKATCEHCNH